MMFKFLLQYFFLLAACSLQLKAVFKQGAAPEEATRLHFMKQSGSYSRLLLIKKC
jgi:hypothetical protein